MKAMWIFRLWRRSQVEADMRDEMEFHREARINDLVALGMDPEEAARSARLEFGNAEAYREECRKELGYRPWDELCADLRFAVRGMKNNPTFSAATIIILALAIGVNGAFFSLYSNYVLKPLPIRQVANRRVCVRSPQCNASLSKSRPGSRVRLRTGSPADRHRSM